MKKAYRDCNSDGGNWSLSHYSQHDTSIISWPSHYLVGDFIVLFSSLR